MRTSRSDDGFSLVEAIIAMFFLAVIALAVLPLAVQATALSTVNRDHAAANALASSELATVRSKFPDEAANTCAAVQDMAHPRVDDPAATGLKADVTVSIDCPAEPAVTASCPTGSPVSVTCPARFGVLTVTARVFETESATDPVVKMATQIVVTAP